MGSFSLTHWLVVILVIVLLFGRGRISDLMGDFAKGINSFKKGLNDDAATPPPPQVTQNQQSPAKSPVEEPRG
jgi:sec-independent protein translocase protein TatA